MYPKESQRGAAVLWRSLKAMRRKPKTGVKMTTIKRIALLRIFVRLALYDGAYLGNNDESDACSSVWCPTLEAYIIIITDVQHANTMSLWCVQYRYNSFIALECVITHAPAVFLMYTISVFWIWLFSLSVPCFATMQGRCTRRYSHMWSIVHLFLNNGLQSLVHSRKKTGGFTLKEFRAYNNNIFKNLHYN